MHVTITFKFLELLQSQTLDLLGVELYLLKIDGKCNFVPHAVRVENLYLQAICSAIYAKGVE